MAIPPRNIFGQDAERHVSLSVYRPLSTNSHAVPIPESTMYHKTNNSRLFEALKFHNSIVGCQ
jgi:hypothetical protein